MNHSSTLSRPLSATYNSAECKLCQQEEGCCTCVRKMADWCTTFDCRAATISGPSLARAAAMCTQILSRKLTCLGEPRTTQQRLYKKRSGLLLCAWQAEVMHV